MLKKSLPALFIGHGSPMYAIRESQYSRSLTDLGQSLGQPSAILCISAHWVTHGTCVTHALVPRTIHDFHGFPQELFDVRYPCPGSVELAERVVELVPEAQLDESWGIDHGTWSVLKWMYPRANVPVVQLSIDIRRPGLSHLGVGQALAALRSEDVLLVGSGNVVHNLRQIRREVEAPAYPWALSFDQWVHEKLEKRDYRALAKDFLEAPGGRQSIPTSEHYLPLLYAAGAATPGKPSRLIHAAIENGSLSMRSVLFE